MVYKWAIGVVFEVRLNILCLSDIGHHFSSFILGVCLTSWDLVLKWNRARSLCNRITQSSVAFMSTSTNYILSLKLVPRRLLFFGSPHLTMPNRSAEPRSLDIMPGDGESGFQFRVVGQTSYRQKKIQSVTCASHQTTNQNSAPKPKAKLPRRPPPPRRGHGSGDFPGKGSLQGKAWGQRCIAEKPLQGSRRAIRGRNVNSSCKSSWTWELLL